MEHSILLQELNLLEQQIATDEKQLEILLSKRNLSSSTSTTTTSSSTTTITNATLSNLQQLQQQQRIECIVCLERLPIMLGDQCNHVCVCEQCSSGIFNLSFHYIYVYVYFICIKNQLCFRCVVQSVANQSILGGNCLSINTKIEKKNKKITLLAHSECIKYIC